MQIRYIARGGSTGRGSGQDDMHASVTGDINVAGSREGRLPDALSWLGRHLGVVVLTLVIVEAWEVP